jgi:hypothetical protein
MNAFLLPQAALGLERLLQPSSQEPTQVDLKSGPFDVRCLKQKYSSREDFASSVECDKEKISWLLSKDEPEMEPAGTESASRHMPLGLPPWKD